MSMKLRSMLIVALMPVIGIVACGKSSEEIERQNATREAAMQKALADSAAEERAKDQQMREAAAAQASERIAGENAAHEAELAGREAAGPTPEQNPGRPRRRAAQVRGAAHPYRRRSLDHSIPQDGVEPEAKRNVRGVQRQDPERRVCRIQARGGDRHPGRRRGAAVARHADAVPGFPDRGARQRMLSRCGEDSHSA